MKKHDVFIGIDISKLKLDLIGIDNNGSIVYKHHTIENKAGFIKKAFRKLTSNISQERLVVCFEDTGVYGLTLSVVLEELGVKYCSLSALEVHRSKGIKRGKSDKSDALTIAQYGLSNYFKLKFSKVSSDKLMKLKQLFTQREKITKALKQFESNKELEGFISKAQLKELNKTNNSILKNLKKNLKIVEEQLSSIIKLDEELSKNMGLVKSIPGIGDITAIYLLIVTKGFTSFDSSRKLACYAGVAPFPYQSGSSIHGRNKVNHLADKKLKSLLNMCALNAKRYDPELNEYYERKCDEGKNKMLVMNNIRNKLLGRVISIVKRQTPYVNIKKYAA